MEYMPSVLGVASLVVVLKVSLDISSLRKRLRNMEAIVSVLLQCPEIVKPMVDRGLVKLDYGSDNLE